MWSVYRVNDDGRREFVNGGMCVLAAEKVAGALRDASTEREIHDGWNYLAARGTDPISAEQEADGGACFTSMRMFDARWRTEDRSKPGPMNSPHHQATSDSLRRSREAVKDQPRRGLGRSGERGRAPLTSTVRRG